MASLDEAFNTLDFHQFDDKHIKYLPQINKDNIDNKINDINKTYEELLEENKIIKKSNDSNKIKVGFWKIENCFNYYDNELENINLPINDFLKTII